MGPTSKGKEGRGRKEPKESGRKEVRGWEVEGRWSKSETFKKRE